MVKLYEIDAFYEALVEEQKALVVWQKAPDDEPIFVDGYEGIPYITPSGHNRVAVVKDGEIIDSYSIDITTGKISHLKGWDEYDKHYYFIWDTYTVRLIANESIVKRAMRLGAKLRNAGWTEQLAHNELRSLSYGLERSAPIEDFVSLLGTRNLINSGCDEVVFLAVEAYDFFKNTLISKKAFKSQIIHECETCTLFSVMKLALYIALINPCLGRTWEKPYCQQGRRSKKKPLCQSEKNIRRTSGQTVLF